MAVSTISHIKNSKIQKFNRINKSQLTQGAAIGLN